MQRILKNGISDPVHKWISFTSAEKNLIDSPLFQRLRHIKQMTLNNMVFPGANNTRFDHSLGVAHIATIYAKTLQSKYPHLPILNDTWVQNVRIAGLLHDIAHGPFSHAYDDFVYSKMYNSEKGHDEHRMKIISVSSMQTLIWGTGAEIDSIRKIWTGEDIIGGAILQGPLGADRMDFLLRDAHFTGVHTFSDYDRIIHNVRLNAAENQVAYPTKIINQIESFLVGRYWMYEGVYLHKTVIACYIVLKSIFEKIVGPLDLINRTNDINGAFLDMTEDGLLSEAVKYAPAEVNNLKRRILPKLIVNTDPDEPNVVMTTKPIHTLDQP
jgi:HD superfamily phosphohydrolase